MRTVVVIYADDRKEERPFAGPVTIEACDRSMTTITSWVRRFANHSSAKSYSNLWALIVDCTKRTLTPRLPGYLLLNLKWPRKSSRRRETNRQGEALIPCSARRGKIGLICSTLSMR